MERAMPAPSLTDFAWDVSGFVRLFYILSKNKFFPHYPKNILYFYPIIPYFIWISRKFYVKIYFSSKSRI